MQSKLSFWRAAGWQVVGLAVTVLAAVSLSVGCSCDEETSGNSIDAAMGDSAAEASVLDAAKIADAQPDGAKADDAQLDAQRDAVVDAGGCDFGSATSAATATMESLFGERVPFADDRELPAGMYEIAYMDGCFKYASNQGWTIHAFDTGVASWHLVSGNAGPMNPQVLLPGTVGINPGVDAYADFEDCVTANRALEPLLYDHAGGALGIWLADTNYPDNVVGEDNRNPQWSLRALATCEELDAGGV